MDDSTCFQSFFITFSDFDHVFRRFYWCMQHKLSCSCSSCSFRPSTDELNPVSSVRKSNLRPSCSSLTLFALSDSFSSSVPRFPVAPQLITVHSIQYRPAPGHWVWINSPPLKTNHAPWRSVVEARRSRGHRDCPGVLQRVGGRGGGRLLTIWMVLLAELQTDGGRVRAPWLGARAGVPAGSSPIWVSPCRETRSWRWRLGGGGEEGWGWRGEEA